MIDFQIPLSGMKHASESLDRTASRIAAAPFSQGDSVDLSSEMVGLMTARTSFEVNVKSAQTEDQMSRNLISFFG
jgi:flagellar basal body rod protein FlgG